MASDLNKVILIGRLTKNPEIKQTQSGTSVANFSLACNKTYVQEGEKKEMVSFFSCVAWTKLGELIVKYCKKGHRLGIEGRLQQRSWEDQNGNKRSTVEIVVDNVQFLTPKDGAEPAQASQDGSGGAQNAPANTDNVYSDDDIPF